MAGRPRCTRMFCALLVATVLLAASATPLMRAIPVARADTLTVCPSGCTYTHIQDAINNASSGDTISIGAGTYAERLQVTYSITLTGAGAGSTIIDGGQGGTVVTVNSGLTVNISGVTIQNGMITGATNQPGSGGGIYNSGALTISSSIIVGNAALGGPGGGDGDGGGIYNVGTLTLVSTTVSSNIASGGAGYNVNDHCICTAYGGSGGAANGSGVYNAGTLILTNSTVSTNTASGGGGGFAYNTVCCGNIGSAAGGTGGSIMGAGVYNSGTLTSSGTSIMGNGADGGVGGGAGYDCGGSIGCAAYGGIGGSSGGAGLYNSPAGGANVISSTVGNNSGNGGGGGPGTPYGAAGSALGGGIDSNSPLTLTNSTISTNAVTGGVGSGGNGTGGGLYAAGTVNIVNVTISNNSATAASASGSGGGIYVASGGVTVQNTIIGRNAATTQGPDCFGTLTSNGYNLLANGADCSGLSAAGDQINVNPRLIALQDNGGPTWTMALFPDSPAVNAGNPSGCTDPFGNPLTTDQRGMPRPDPVSGRCDIGAYEYQPPTPTPTNTPTAPPNTDTPTATKTPAPPTATNTPIPPTATPTPIATFAISPSSGVYGQSIRLTGSNFGPREQVNIVSGAHGTVVYTATTTLAGSFGITNTVRQGVYGPLILTAIGQSSHRQAGAPFAIKAETLPRTITAKPGGRIVLSGYGFGAHETVKATWAPGNLALGHAVTNSLGTFAGGTALTVTVPLSPTGTYHIYSVGQSSKAVAASVVHLSGRGAPEADKRAAAP